MEVVSHYRIQRLKTICQVMIPHVCISSPFNQQRPDEADAHVPMEVQGSLTTPRMPVSASAPNKRNPMLRYAYVCPSLSYNLVVITIKRVRPPHPGPQLLSLDILLATTDTSEPLLECAAHALARRVAASDTRGVGFSVQRLSWHGAGCAAVVHAACVRVAGRHFGARVAGALVVFEGPFYGEGGLAFAFEVVGVVGLRTLVNVNGRWGSRRACPGQRR